MHKVHGQNNSSVSHNALSNKLTHNSQMTLEEEPVKKMEDISVELEVPRFIEELSDQEVTEGDTVTLYVQVDGKPFPKLTW